ncbi:CIH_collapsed_G0018440.mRNA.1.CDS.1 [Saccharomyces cerevisiae]|nr:CIH_collapsed_G0018440.mRNA.1.CDS.1 [Saccharomyces cerevisiae]
MLFNINRQEDDPFTQLINQSSANTQNQQAHQQESPYQFLQKVVSNEPKGKEEWVSPFRQDALANRQNNRAYGEDAKNRKFPTVSATSAYSKQQPKDLGYKNIPKNAKRAKDIRFPTYLTQNEERQYQLLTELELKEKHLKYLKKCQKITDLTKDEKDDTDTTTSSESTSIGKGTADSAQINVAEPISSENGVLEPRTTDQSGGSKSDVVPTDEQKEEKSDVKKVNPPSGEEKKEMEAEGDAEEETEQSSAEESTERTSTPETSEPESEEDESPIDPSKAPKVPFQEPSRKERTGIFALWKSPTSSSTQKSKTAAPSNPVATPENPELIVKTKEHGYLSKAVYDKINYDEKVHQAWLADLRAKEKDKYDAKNKEYKDKLQDLQNQIDEIENSMKAMREETSEKIEVSKNRLVKKIIDVNAEHNNKKLMILKDTENMKNQKLQEKNEVLDKQTNVKSEIDDLNNEKTNVQKEFNDWTTNLSNLSQQLDAQIFKINQINLKQGKVQNEIDNLEKKKEDLVTQTEENKKLHEKNVQVLESVENKEYLPQINDIDNQISSLLNEMTIIKQENANEKTQLSAITRRLEDERRAHEEQLKLEAEERKRKEENLLEKQRQELEEQAHQAQLDHEQQITQVKQTYNDQLTELQDKLAAEEKELEAVKRERTRLQAEKAIEEQTRQKNADEALKQEILSRQHKQAEGIHAAENHKIPNDRSQKNTSVLPKDDSLYEYHTEEDVMYA